MASGISPAKTTVRRLHGSLNWAIAAMEENICSMGLWVEFPKGRGNS